MSTKKNVRRFKKSYVLSEGRCHRGQIQAMVPLGVTEGSAGHTASATTWQWLQQQLNGTMFLGDNIDFWPFLFKTGHLSSHSIWVNTLGSQRY